MSLDTVEKICFKEKNENNPIKQTKTNNITKLCGRSAHKPKTVFEAGDIFDFTISRPTTCVAPVDASRDFIYFLRTSSVGGGGGVCCQTFSFVLFSLFSRPRAGLATV